MTPLLDLSKFDLTDDQLEPIARKAGLSLDDPYPDYGTVRKALRSAMYNPIPVTINIRREEGRE